MNTEQKHLWEAPHVSTRFCARLASEYPSWASFIADLDGSEWDPDDLLVKWDWGYVTDDSNGHMTSVDELRMVFLLQELGVSMFVSVRVSAADEDAIKGFLRKEFLKLKEAWDLPYLAAWPRECPPPPPPSPSQRPPHTGVSAYWCVT